jgi:TRAP-type C4-dicarboxylate transport system substrate-binding protein
MIKHTLLAAVLCVASPAVAQTTLKIATLAPEGSSWMNLFHKWQHAVEARTEGRVKVKFYSGGVQGDERDVLRKIRLGQLSGGAVTAIGLSAIDPEVRALEIAHTYEELDGLRAALGDDLKKKFEEKGYILAGWGDVGPIHIFSNRPVRTLEDLRQTKLWMWSDDPITKQLLTELEIRGVPLDVPSVLPALATGTIDAFFGSPLSTVALQWGSHAKYVTSMVMGQATGATVISKKVWDTISPADQKILLEEGNTMQSQVLAQIRSDNTIALDRLKANGLQVVPTPVELQKELDKRSEAVARAVGATMSKAFQDKVAKLVEDYRSKHK